MIRGSDNQGSGDSGKLRVLHVVGGLGNSSGTTHIILNLSRELANLGCEVSVFYISGRAPNTVLPEDSRVKAEGFSLTWNRTWGYSRGFGGALAGRVSQFDVVNVHSLWLYINVAVWRTCLRAEVPFVVSPQGALDDWTLAYHSLRKRLYGALIERRILRDAAVVHGVSATEADSIRRFMVAGQGFGALRPRLRPATMPRHAVHTTTSQGNPGPAVAVVPNGVNCREWAGSPPRAEARRRFGLGDDDLAVLFLGRLNPKKGLDVLIKAFAGAFHGEIRTKLLIAGADKGTGYGQTVEQMVRESGIGDRTVMAGEVSGETKRAALAAADMFVLPSHSEGMPVAVLEAMACGLPVIVSPGCNLPEVASYGAGLVVDTEAEAVSAAMTRLANDDAVRMEMGRKARNLAETVFDWRVVAKQMLGVYQSAVGAREGSAHE